MGVLVSTGAELMAGPPLGVVKLEVSCRLLPLCAPAYTLMLPLSLTASTGTPPSQVALGAAVALIATKLAPSLPSRRCSSVVGADQLLSATAE